MLRWAARAVFSKSAALRATVQAPHAGGNQRVRLGWRKGRAIRGWRQPMHAPEAAGERANRAEADGHADFGDRAVRVAQQRRGALEAPRKQVRVRRLAKGAAEFANEVGAREASRLGQVVDAERLEVTGVGEVLGAQ